MLKIKDSIILKSKAKERRREVKGEGLNVRHG
jgi:hypothetical protein